MLNQLGVEAMKPLKLSICSVRGGGMRQAIPGHGVWLLFLFFNEFCFSQIISEYYRVYGNADNPIWFNAYNIESTSALDCSGSGEAYSAPPGGSGDGLISGIYTHTKAGNLSIETSALGTDDCAMFFGASSSYELRFNTANIQIHLSISGYNTNWFPDNDPSILYHLKGPDVNDYLSWDLVPNFDEIFSYDIVPNAVYNLYLASNMETDPTTGNSKITVTILPEPTTLLLFVVGVLCCAQKGTRF